MKASIYSLTFKDKEKFLTLFSNRILTVICGIISATILFTFIYFSLTWLNIIQFNLISFIGHFVAILLLGIISVYLKLLEYRLEMISYKESTIHDIIPNFLYVFMLATLVLYMLGYYLLAYLSDPVKNITNNGIKFEDISSLIVIALIGSIILAYMLSSAWSWIYTNLLNYVSDIDWIAKFDEDAFHRLLPIKFYESKRYHVPLTLGIVDIYNYEEVSKKIGKKKLQKIMLEIMEEINSKLRFVDLVARIDESKKIVVIMNIPTASAHIPVSRVLETIDYFNRKYNMNFKFKGRIVGFSPDMISELDLLKSEGEEVRLEQQ